jgi:hypothetical protein
MDHKPPARLWKQGFVANVRMGLERNVRAAFEIDRVVESDVAERRVGTGLNLFSIRAFHLM